MRKYDETLVLKIGIIISCCFMLVVVLLASGIKINFNLSRFKLDNPFKKTGDDKNKAESEINEEMLKSNIILATDITQITQGRLIINLPRGVNENNTQITKDLLHKRIKISFPKGALDYDYSKNENNTQVVSNINYTITDNVVVAEVELSLTMDCVTYFDNGQIFIDFFAPSDSGMPVVVIDPGHGGNDVGAVQNGVYEKDIDLEICLKLAGLFEQEGVLVYYTRLDDSYPSVEERVDFVNELNPDLFISVHSNWYENSNSYGSSALYNVNDTSEFNSMRLSEIMCAELTASCGTYNRGVVKGNDIHIVRHSNVPVALMEVGFMSNSDDFKILTTDSGQEKIAKGIYNGIIRALTEMGKY